jgi:hypothetical protein
VEAVDVEPLNALARGRELDRRLRLDSDVAEVRTSLEGRLREGERAGGREQSGGQEAGAQRRAVQGRLLLIGSGRDDTAG